MKYLYLILTSSILLTGCGGSDSSDDEPNEVDSLATIKEEAIIPTEETTLPIEEPTLIGKFKDSSTSGLDYSIGDYHAKTDINGNFKYFSETDSIIFSVGGVVLGSATVKDVVTPIDLIENGSSENLNVQNIVRFLLALDSDEDPTNGINITAAVAEEAESWGQIDFTTETLETEITNKISRELIILNAQDAREHIESTYNCMYSGLWVGEYSGTEDNGYFFNHTSIDTGITRGKTYSVKYPLMKMESSQNTISYQNSMALFSGDASTGSTFTGQFDTINTGSGTWSLKIPEYNIDTSGTLSAERFNKDLTYNHRFTAILSDNTESGYSTSTEYYISIDINDGGEYEAGIYSFNENILNDSTWGLYAEKRIAKKYVISGNVVDDGITISLTDINKIITLSTTSDKYTATASLLDASDTTIDSKSVDYCNVD
jgi:hypothetical protein